MFSPCCAAEPWISVFRSGRETISALLHFAADVEEHPQLNALNEAVREKCPVGGGPLLILKEVGGDLRESECKGRGRTYG